MYDQVQTSYSPERLAYCLSFISPLQSQAVLFVSADGVLDCLGKLPQEQDVFPYFCFHVPLIQTQRTVQGVNTLLSSQLVYLPQCVA